MLERFGYGVSVRTAMAVGISKDTCSELASLILGSGSAVALMSTIALRRGITDYVTGSRDLAMGRERGKRGSVRAIIWLGSM